MFVIRQSQLDAFRLPYREKVRQQAMAGLRADGFDVEPLPDGRSFVATDERGAQTRLTYTDRILPETVRQPLGEEYHLTYTRNGQLSGINYPGGEQIQLSRTSEGLITRLQTAPEQTFSLDYKEGILKRVTYPGGTFRQFGHNASGLLTHLTDRNGHTRQYVRDELNGQLVGLIDPLNRATQFTFDEGYLTGVTYCDGSRQTVAYDEEEETLYVSLRDGKGFIQQYDGEHLRELTWQDGPWVRFTHDADGRPLSIRNPDSQITFGYADHGLASEQGILGTSQLTYNDGGQLTQLHLATGLVVGYGYDLNGRLSHIDAGNQQIQYEYGPNGLLLNTSYPNGLRQQERQQHLGGLQHTCLTDKSGKTLTEQRYTYDAEQRLTGIEDPLSGQVRTLTYDAESHLLSVADRQTGQVHEQFSYDAVGTLQQLNGWPVRSGPMGEIRAVGPDAWQYDALGNATLLRGPKGPMQLELARNSTLTSLAINGQRWQYTYDGLGRRISKTDGQVRWQYAWLEGRLLAETYQSTPQARPVVRQYIYHPDAYTPVAFLEGEQLYTLHTDNRGAVTHAFDSRGTLVWQGEYSAFGNCRELVNRIRQPLRLAGQYADDESGLYYNVGRYYAPFVGQYISLDPQWLEHLDTHNYAYARQDPYGRHDPLGDFGPLLITGGAALVGGLISAGVTAYQGGSWRQVGASFVHGALSGAGAAVGAMVGGIPGMMAGAAAGGFLGTLAEQAINGDPLSIVCALQAAAIEGLLAGALGLAGKLLGPVLGRLGRAVANSRIGQAIGRMASRALSGARSGIRRVGQAVNNRLSQFSRKAIPYKPGWSSDRVRAIPKGQRPDPSEYLSQKHIDDHLAHFDKEGGSFVIDKSATETSRFTKLPPRKYIMSNPDMDASMAKYRKSGNVDDLEDALGYSRGDLAGKESDLYIATAKKGKLKYGMPDGNEIGANEHWEPGGKTSGGKREAVILGNDGKPVSIDHNNNIDNLSEWFDLQKINK